MTRTISKWATIQTVGLDVEDDPEMLLAVLDTLPREYAATQGVTLMERTRADLLPHRYGDKDGMRVSVPCEREDADHYVAVTTWMATKDSR